MPSTMQGQHRKNRGQQRISLVIFLVFHPGPLPDRIDFFYWGSRGGRPQGLSDGNRRGDGDAFLHDLHHPLPDAGEGLILLAPHLCAHPLIEFGHHPFSKTLVKKKKKKQKKTKERERNRKKQSIDKFFFSSISMFHRTKAKGSRPRQWKARVHGSTKSLKSSIVLAYSMAMPTRSLYRLLSFGHLLTVHNTIDKVVSKWQNKSKEKKNRLTMLTKD